MVTVLPRLTTFPASGDWLMTKAAVGFVAPVNFGTSPACWTTATRWTGG